MAGKLGGNDDQPISEINVVPLVDIILVVLIIFMVTAPMIMKPSIDVKLPKASTGQDTKPSQLAVSIGKDGKILFNDKIVELAQVKDLAEDVVAADSEVQAVISADQDVPHGQVIGVIDQIKLAGVIKFAISVDKK